MKPKSIVPFVLAGVAVLLLGVGPSFAGGGSAGARPDTASPGSVAGRVHFQGPPPKLTTYTMNADPACAKLHPGSNPTEDFVTGSDGTLGNVIVFISDGLGGRTFDPPSEPAVLEQKGCQYKPHVLAMRANQKLKLLNSDTTTHNVHPVPANNREWNKAEPAGSEMEDTFAREEIAIPLKCNVHPWMRGYVAVFKHPYFAVTNKDGSFDLHNLPPGEYTVEAWHEKLGTLTQKITVAPGESKSVDFTFKSR
jgi:plastocyanin